MNGCKARFPALAKATEHWGNCYIESQSPMDQYIWFDNVKLTVDPGNDFLKRQWTLCFGALPIYVADSYEDLITAIDKMPLIGELLK